MNRSATEAAATFSSREQFFDRYKNVVDEFGFNLASYEGVEEFVRVFYERWFKVQVTGLRNLPAGGSALLFGNHSGVLPVDACLLYDGMINLHPAPRRIRFLVTKFLLQAPLLGAGLRGYGCVPPDYDVATELLRRQELVFFYPEAEKGTGKLFKNRYKLVDFHVGFVRAAIATCSPLIPVVTIGGDEIYPLLGNLELLAKLLHAPYFPVTPFFPLLPFPFSMIPLPVRILITVGRPLKLRYPAIVAENEDVVAEVASDIRSYIQTRVDDLLEIRTGPFRTWDMNAVNEYLEKSDSRSHALQRHLL